MSPLGPLPRGNRMTAKANGYVYAAIRPPINGQALQLDPGQNAQALHVIVLPQELHQTLPAVRLRLSNAAARSMLLPSYGL